MKLYAAFSKTEEQPDGTMKVWGYASSAAEDSDGETVTPECMKAALPDYMKWGAVREMHSPNKAAGTAIEASVGDDGKTFFGAHVVDAEACLKLRTNVYKGFSIGGRVTQRDDLNKSIIKAIKLVEVSLVDRPANPEAVFTLIKADLTPQDDVTELADMLDVGKVKPGDLLALVKAAQVATEAATEKVAAEKAAAVAKGMTHVADLAYLLKQVMYLVKDQMAEAAREGDGSVVPAKLVDWLNAGGEVLKDMVTEEVAELAGGTEVAASVVDYGDGQMLYMAERCMTLTKSGAALSAKNKAHIGKIHDACKALGACDGATKAAHEGELAKALTDHAEELGKALGELGKATARAVAAEAAVEPLKARIVAFEAMPAPGKALLKAIGKGEDVSDPAAAAAPVIAAVTKSDGAVDETATLIKAIHASRLAA